MTVALRLISSAPAAAPAAGGGRIARVQIIHALTEAEPHWRALERSGALATPYQRFEFLSLWQRHIGSARGVTPFIVVGFDAAGAPMFLLPFGQRRVAGLRVIEFLGGKHANFNVALWRRDLAPAIGETALAEVVASLAAHADALILRNQSLTWQGATNPLALLPHQMSPNLGYSGALNDDFETLFRARTNSAARKKIRKKEASLAAQGKVAFERATAAADARRLLDAFFKQKSVRMKIQGVRDVFAEPGVRRFVEAAATEPAGAPAVELYALSLDDIVIATIGGIAGGGRFCAMFNSIVPGRFAAESPGEQLLLHLVHDCCVRGLSTFDLGVGQARYKSLFCNDAEPLFDTFIPLSRAGHLLTASARVASWGKRLIKRTPMLWSAVGRLRRLYGWMLPH